MIHHKPIHQMAPGPTSATAHHMHHSVNMHQTSLQPPPPQQMHPSQHTQQQQQQHMNPNIHQSLHTGSQHPQQQKQTSPPSQQQPPPIHILQRDNRMNQQQRIQQPKSPAHHQPHQQQQQHYNQQQQQQQQSRGRTISNSSNSNNSTVNGSHPSNNNNNNNVVVETQNSNCNNVVNNNRQQLQQQQPQQLVVKKILQNVEKNAGKQHNGYANNFNNNNNNNNKCNINENDATTTLILTNDKSNLNVNNNNINVVNKEKLQTSSSSASTIILLDNMNNNNEQLISETNLITETPTIQIPSQKSSMTSTLSSTSLLSSNIKEKTPMCLVNELARYNKIQHQYRLTSENGPPHKKRFTVTLKLGEEEYSSDGASIKKAQHAAADVAVGLTKYKHPLAKTKVIIRNCNGGLNGNGNKSNTITPTVELNALAMKRGEAATYIVEQHEPISSVVASPMNNAYANFHTNKHQNAYAPSSRFNDKRFVSNRSGGNNAVLSDASKETYHVTLQVGERKFIGIGHTLQSARHNAASNALNVLRPLTPEVSLDGSITSLDDSNSELKSPISVLYEKALIRDLPVIFEVQSEKGPPHMKSFITTCRIGTLVSEGTGNGKKMSKRRAAENMLDEFKKLPPMPPSQPATNDELSANGITDAQQKRQTKQKRAKQTVKKKTRNLIKDQTDEPITEITNPVSRLIQIQQLHKEKVPIYSLLDERGPPRRREFTISVEAGGFTAEGTGPNKRIAKRIAASNLIIAMGMEDILSEADITLAKTPFKSNFNKTELDANVGDETKVTPADNDNVDDVEDDKSSVVILDTKSERRLKRNLAKENRKRKVTFSEPPDIALTTPTQKISIKKNNTKSCLSKKASSDDGDDVEKGTNDDENQLDEVTSSTTTTNTSSKKSNNVSTVNGIRPKDQLMYLAQLLGFGVHFCDFPKGNHSEYLTLVTLTTEPPQLCHGSGDSIEASNDQGAKEALRILSELGLDNVKPKNKDKQSDATSTTSSVAASSTSSTSSPVAPAAAAVTVADSTTKVTATAPTTASPPTIKSKQQNHHHQQRPHIRQFH